MVLLLPLLPFLILLSSVSPDARPQERIVGGADASLGEFPFMASLVHKPLFGARYHFCGGSIYNERTVVTAAHCCRANNIAKVTVRVGALHRQPDTDDTEQEVNVAHFNVHEHYDDRTLENDICVVLLAAPLRLDQLVAPVPVPQQDEEVEAGEICTVIGWGKTSQGGAMADTLQKVHLPIVSDEDCRSVYGEDRVAASMVCAGWPEGGKDSCQGDSGGPLICGGELTGVVSWGEGCAYPGNPGVYTQASYFRNWIEENAA